MAVATGWVQNVFSYFLRRGTEDLKEKWGWVKPKKRRRPVRERFEGAEFAWTHKRRTIYWQKGSIRVISDA